MKVLRTASLGSNFTGSYQKNNVVHCVKTSFYQCRSTLKLINHTKEQQNTIHRLITNFCVKLFTFFQTKKIMNLRIQPHAIYDKFFKK